MEYDIDEILQSKRNIFITGAAGTGKSYMTKQIIECITGKTYICAPTGVAALSVGGTTFHQVCGLQLCIGSVQQLHARTLRSQKLKKQWLTMDTLVIDEISMMDLSMFVRMAKVIGLLRFEEGVVDKILPFGGVRLILVGDFLQLPPVQKYSEKDGDETRTYTYMFEHSIWSEIDPQVIHLTRPMRYINDPEGMEFAQILSDVRMGIMSDRVINMMKRCSTKPEEHVVGDHKITPTILIATNKEVDSFNKKKLDQLQGPEFVFNSTFEPSPNCSISKEDMVKKSLVSDPLILKEGAQVMLLKNHIDRGLCNGSRGVVTGFTDNDLPIVTFLDGQSMIIEYHTTSITSKRYDEESNEEVKSKASLTYIPLRLAYAITIHKSQSLTLDYVYLCLETCFAAGQLYVALSRCRNMKNMYIKSWSEEIFHKCRPSKKVLEFYENL